MKGYKSDDLKCVFYVLLYFKTMTSANCKRCCTVRSLFILTSTLLLLNVITVLIFLDQLEREQMCISQTEIHSDISVPSSTISNEIEKEQKESIKKKITTIGVQGSDYHSKDNQFIYEMNPMNIFELRHSTNISLKANKKYSNKKCTNMILKNHMVVHFLNALKIMIHYRNIGYFPIYSCPETLQSLEYRPTSLIPHIYSNGCSPNYSPDIIYLLSRILRTDMIGIQYGYTSSSSAWLSNLMGKLYVVDDRIDIVSNAIDNDLWMDMKLESNNIYLKHQSISKAYVEILDDSYEHLVDVVIMQSIPKYHEHILQYALRMLKVNNGILIINFSDGQMPFEFVTNVTKSIPGHWLKYESLIPLFLVEAVMESNYVPFSHESYLKQRVNVSMWITRSLENPCGSSFV